MLISSLDFASSGPVDCFEPIEQGLARNEPDPPFENDAHFYSELVEALEGTLVDEERRPPFREPSDSLLCPPKSEARIELMRERVERGESPFSMSDRQQPLNVGRIARRFVNNTDASGDLVMIDGYGTRTLEHAPPTEGKLIEEADRTARKVRERGDEDDPAGVVKLMKSMRHRIGTLRYEAISGFFGGRQKIAEVLGEAIELCCSIQNRYSCSTCGGGGCPVCISKVPHGLRAMSKSGKKAKRGGAKKPSLASSAGRSQGVA